MYDKEEITHSSLVSNKMDIMANSVDPDQMRQNGIWSGSTMFALSSEISTKHDNNKN